MRQLRAVLRGSVLIAQLLSATLFLQGCDDEQEEESHPPAAVKDAHQVEDLAAKEDSRGEENALDRVPIVERLPRSAHEEAWGFGRTSQSRSGPSTQLVLVNASSVKRDAKPGQGDRLLDHERAFERALMSGSGASREVHMMVADHYLQDYYKHTSTTTTTTTITTTTTTTTTTSTGSKYIKNSTGSAIDSSWKSTRTRRTTTSTATTTTAAPSDEVLLSNVPAIKVGESNASDENLSFVPPLLAEELSNERSRKLVPEGSGGTWSPATFSAEDAAAAAGAAEGSEDVTSTSSTSPVANSTSSTSPVTTTSTSETAKSTTTTSTASETPTTITTTTAVQIATSEQETKESQDAGELAEEARAKEEALAKQKANASTEPSDSDEDEESEDSSSPSSKTEVTDDDEDDADPQSIMQLHGQPAQESYEDPALQAESMSRVHRLQQDRAALLELQLRQDQQLDELRRRLQRHQEKELERFHQQQQKELEVLRLESEASQWNAMPRMDQEHSHKRHRHGSRKMGQWLQEIVDSSKL